MGVILLRRANTVALVLKDNSYLKVDVDGSYVVYKNKTARNKHKKATDSAIVLREYESRIAKLSSRERMYYGNMSPDELASWTDEYKSYYRHLVNHDATGEYPLMAEVFPDVAKSIPEILFEGRFGWATKFETLSEVYNEIKRRRAFGADDDSKDA